MVNPESNHMSAIRKLRLLYIAAVSSQCLCIVNPALAVPLSSPTVQSGVVSFSFDSGPGELLTVQSSGLLPLEWSDISYHVGTGNQIQFSQPLGAASQLFRVRVNEFRPLDQTPNSPVLTAGSVSLPDADVGAP